MHSSWDRLLFSIERTILRKKTRHESQLMALYLIPFASRSQIEHFSPTKSFFCLPDFFIFFLKNKNLLFYKESLIYLELRTWRIRFEYRNKKCLHCLQHSKYWARNSTSFTKTLEYFFDLVLWANFSSKNWRIFYIFILFYANLGKQSSLLTL